MRRLAIFIFCAIATLIIGVIIILSHPRPLIEFTLHQLERNGIIANWQNFHIESRWQKLLDWKISWQISHLTIQEEGRFLVSVMDSQGAARLRLLPFNFRFIDGRIEAGSEGFWNLTNKSQTANRRDAWENGFSLVQSIERYVDVESVNINVPSFQIQTGLKIYKISSAEVKKEQNEDIDFKASIVDQPSTWLLTVNGAMDLRLLHTRYPFLHSTIKFRSGQYNVTTHIAANGKDSVPQLRFQSIVNPLPFLGTEQSLNGVIYLNEEPRFTVWIPVHLMRLRPALRTSIEKICACSIAEPLSMQLNGNYLSATSVLKLRLQNFENKLLKLDMGGEVDLSHFQSRLTSKLEIKTFRAFGPLLKPFGAFIPAPLDVLDGPVTIEAVNPVIVGPTGIQTTLQMETRLKSEKQTLFSRVTAQVNASNRFRNWDVGIKALIQDMQLELPPINPAFGIPRALPDRRYRSLPKEVAQNKLNLRLKLDIETMRSGSIRLLSNLANPFIPLTLHANISTNQPWAGYLNVEPFEMRYLRRKAQVEFINVGLKSNHRRDFPLQGRIRVDQTQYTIFISIAGTTDSPRITFSSEPQLPHADIISVLLYNRTSDQLVSADLETVGSVEAAVADRAIGLFGLWIFASTPIRSFSYNSLTKVYSASVEVAKGVSVDVGTNWEQTNYLQLRKRISRRLTLSAQWKPEEEASDKGSLTLQWEKRF